MTYISKPYIICLAMLLWLAAPLTASAQILPDLDRLEGKNLYDSYAGKTIDGIYKRPRERSGTHQFTESFKADGTTFYREGEFTQKGRWFIENGDVVCFTYNENGATTAKHCFAIFESGTCQYAYSLNNMRNGKPIHSNAWTAKTLAHGEISSCNNLIS